MSIRSLMQRFLVTRPRPDGARGFEEVVQATSQSDDYPVPPKQVAEKGYLAICAIMKNETIGILEWIAYHRALGVERFFLYDNGSDDDTILKIDALIHSGIIELIDWPKKPGQLSAYDDFAARHRDDWTWCAFIDLDEFINPFGFNNIVDWLGQFDDRSGVAIQWVNFGPNNQDDPPRLATEAYRTRFPDLHAIHGHVKTIVKMAKYDRALSPHSFLVTDGEIVDEHNREVVRQGAEYAIQEPMHHDQVCLNHYYTRSRSEWWIKMNRGRADTGDTTSHSRNAEWLQIYEDEAVYPDDRIVKFAPNVSSMLEELDKIRIERIDL